MTLSQTAASAELPSDKEILAYDEWKASAGSKDTYGHYAEYVVRKTIVNLGGRAKETEDKDDCPGGGDIWVYRSDGSKFIIDIKTTKQRDISFEVTGPGTANIHIPGLDVERLRSQHQETQIRLVEILNDASEELRKK